MFTALAILTLALPLILCAAIPDDGLQDEAERERQKLIHQEEWQWAEFEQKAREWEARPFVHRAVLARGFVMILADYQN